jgi:hypothetical protein
MAWDAVECERMHFRIILGTSSISRHKISTKALEIYVDILRKTLLHIEQFI